MRKLVLLIFVSSLLLLSCGPSKKDEAAKAQQEQTVKDSIAKAMKDSLLKADSLKEAVAQRAAIDSLKKQYAVIAEDNGIVYYLKRAHNDEYGSKYKRAIYSYDIKSAKTTTKIIPEGSIDNWDGEVQAVFDYTFHNGKIFLLVQKVLGTMFRDCGVNILSYNPQTGAMHILLTYGCSDASFIEGGSKVRYKEVDVTNSETAQSMEDLKYEVHTRTTLLK